MSTTTTQRVLDAKARIENLNPAQTACQLADGALVVDLREAAERATDGAIPGAVHVPRGLLEFKAEPSSTARPEGARLSPCSLCTSLATPTSPTSTAAWPVGSAPAVRSSVRTRRQRPPR